MSAWMLYCVAVTALLAGDKDALVISNVAPDPYSTVLGFSLQSLAGGKAQRLTGTPGDAWVADVTK